MFVNILFLFFFQFLVEENEKFQKEKLQEDYNDAYPLKFYISQCIFVYKTMFE